MITHHLFDEQRIYAGKVTASKYDAVPPRSTLQAPPDTEGTEVAQWTGSAWRVLPERPPIPEPAPDSVPQSVTRAQGKAALVQAGLWQAVIEYVEGLSGNDRVLAEIALNDTSNWSRDSPFLNDCAKGIGLTDDALDDLFREAEKIHM